MTENLKAVIFFVLLCLPSLYAQADGIVVDKVYHPYVDALEKEMEYRTVIQDEQEGLLTPAEIHQFAIGTSVGDKLFAEFYAIGTKNRQGNFHLGAWEAELKWQLTEQGEYFADWGLLFEYENDKMEKSLALALPNLNHKMVIVRVEGNGKMTSKKVYLD